LRSDNAYSFVLDAAAADGGIAMVRGFSEFPGISLKHASASPVFHPRGVASVPATITLRSSRDDEIRTSISVAGRITMVTP
jgi:hypothetical protein